MFESTNLYGSSTEDTIVLEHGSRGLDGPTGAIGPIGPAANNNYGRGLMATPASTVSSDTTISNTVDKLQLFYSFTAVAGRTYQFVYFEPSIFGSASGIMYQRIRLSDVSSSITGTVLNTATVTMPTLVQINIRTEAFYTAPSSGPLYIVGTLQPSAGTGQASRSSIRFPLLYAMDVGIV